MKTILKLLPWLIVLILLVFLWVRRMSTYARPEQFSIENTNILQEVETLGKLELVKYRFKEVVEAEELAKRYLDFGLFYFPAGKDQKAVLIATGEAVACVDLTKLTYDDFVLGKDTITITLPQPELCYYKVDLDKSNFYDLETSQDSKKAGEFIDKVYKKAESEIKSAALQSGILQDAQKMAANILKPIFSRMIQKEVVFKFNNTIDIDTENKELLKK